jgi:hypothetical protein
MPLGLFPRETQDLLAGSLDTGTTPPPQPGFWSGAFSGLIPGAESGLTSMALASPLVSSQTPFGMNLPESAYAKEKIPDDQFQAQLANDTTAALKSFTPDPHVVGAAGQALFGLSSGLTRILAGAAIAGPIGGAVAVGGSEGVATTRELQAGGVDKNTADALGAGAALFSGVGALLPGGVGKTLLERVTTGAYGQFGLGLLNRGLMHNVLDEAGYTDMAKAYQPLDGAAVMSDIVLGMGFGAVHHAFAPKPSDLDAAHAVKDAQQVEEAAGGPAADPQSRTNLIDNQTNAAEKLVSGDETAPGSADVRVVPDPAQERARQASAAAVEEAGREAGAERVEVPAEPQPVADVMAETQARVEAKPPEPPKAEGEPAAPVLDPVTAEAVGQAEDALNRLGDVKIENDNGEMVSATETLRRSIDDIKNAQGDSELHRVAAACFGRG